MHTKSIFTSSSSSLATSTLLPKAGKYYLAYSPFIRFSPLIPSSCSSSSLSETFAVADPRGQAPESLIINSPNPFATVNNNNRSLIVHLRPLTNSKRRPRPHRLLRHFYKVFGLDLFQGKRISFSSIEKEFGTFATTSEILNAIDCSALLRWVPKTDISWIDVAEDSSADKKIPNQNEEKTKGNEDVPQKSINNVSSSSSSSQPLPVSEVLFPLHLEKTQVYRRHVHVLTNHFDFAGSRVSPLYSSSSEAVMRSRRKFLVRRSKTHDVVLLGTPCQVFRRYSSQDTLVNNTMRLSRCSFAEGLSHYLDYGEFAKRQIALFLRKQEQQRTIREQQQQQKAKANGEKLKFSAESDLWEELARPEKTNATSVKLLPAQSTAISGEQMKEFLQGASNVGNSLTNNNNNNNNNNSKNSPTTAENESPTQYQRENQQLENYRQEQSFHEFFAIFTRTLQSKVPGFSTIDFLASRRSRENFVAIPTIKMESLAACFVPKQLLNANERQITILRKVVHFMSSFHRIPFPVSSIVVQSVYALPVDLIDVGQVIYDLCENVEKDYRRRRKFFDATMMMKRKKMTTIMTSAGGSSFAYLGEEILQEEIEAQSFPPSSTAVRDYDAFFGKQFTERLYLQRSKFGSPVCIMILSKNSKLGRNDFGLIDGNDNGGEKKHHKFPLCAWVGDSSCSILGNIWDSIERCSRVASPIANLVDLNHRQIFQSSANANSSPKSVWVSYCSAASPRCPVTTTTQTLLLSENSQEGENVVFVQSSKVAVISNLKHVCQVSGWTSEFGSGADQILLKRFLIGLARDVVGIWNFSQLLTDISSSSQTNEDESKNNNNQESLQVQQQQTSSSLSASELSQQNRKSGDGRYYVSAVFAKPVKISSSSSSFPAVFAWAAAVPKKSKLPVLCNLRRELEKDSLWSANGVDDDDDEKHVAVELEKYNKKNNMSKYLAFEIVRGELYVLLIRDSDLAVTKYHREQQEMGEMVLASAERILNHVHGAAFYGSEEEK